MITRILWIEDNATQDLAYWAAPVFMEGSYDLTVAQNASEALTRTLEGEYDAVIVDVRLPPGPSREWVNIYTEAAVDGREPQLGLELLYCLLGHPKAKVKISDRPEWLRPERFAVLTVERFYQTEVKNCLDDVGIDLLTEKTAATPDTILIDLVDLIRKKRGM